MAVARIITQAAEDAEPLRRQLLARGYSVEVFSPQQAAETPPDQHVELEIRLERCSAEVAIAAAQRFAGTQPGDASVFIAPGVLRTAGVPVESAEPQVEDTTRPVLGAGHQPRTKPGKKVEARKKEPVFRSAFAAALRDAGRAFRWAERKATDRLLDGLESGSAWLARVGPRLVTPAVRIGRAISGTGSGLRGAGRATLTSTRDSAAEVAAGSRRAARRTVRQVQLWYAETAARQRTMRLDWHEFRQARREHQAAWAERQAALRRRELEEARRQETGRLAQRPQEPPLHAAPLKAETHRARPAVLPGASLRPRRAVAAAAALVVAAVLLWNGLAGRRAADYLPEEPLPQAGVQEVPFSGIAEPQVAPAALLDPEVEPPPAPRSDPAAESVEEPIPPPVIRQREPEVVVRHFEPPARRDDSSMAQDSSVKRITDLD